MTNLSGISEQLQMGKAGEHLVCYSLILQGYNAFLSDAGLPYDILVEVDGALKRVQVKSSVSARCVYSNGYSKTYAYAFMLRAGKGAKRCIKQTDVDYIAFAFLDIGVVQYLPTKDLTDRQTGNLIQGVQFHKRRGKYVIGKFNTLESSLYKKKVKLF